MGAHLLDVQQRRDAQLHATEGRPLHIHEAFLQTDVAPETGRVRPFRDLKGTQALTRPPSSSAGSWSKTARSCGSRGTGPPRCHPWAEPASAIEKHNLIEDITCTQVTTSSLRSRNRIIARLHGGAWWAHVSPLCTTTSDSMSTRFILSLISRRTDGPAKIRVIFSQLLEYINPSPPIRR